MVICDGGEDAELGVQVFIHGHDRGNVAAAVAVVGGRPNCHDGFLGEVVLSCC